MQVSMRPDWSEIDAVRDRAAVYLLEHQVDSNAADAVSMVVGELVENAAKYGIFRRSHDSIQVAVFLTQGEIVVEVSNPVGPGELDHVHRLEGMIQWIRGFQDPFEAYLERLKELSAQELASAESGLGLVRIAYEGQSVLDFVVKDQNTLSVSAVFPVEAGRFT